MADRLPMGNKMALCMMAAIVLLQGVTALPGTQAAAISDTTVTPETLQPIPAANILTSGTIIDLVFVETVDSKANKTGEIIAMKVADDVLSGTAVIIPAGSPVSAEIIHAARARAGGKPGELIVSARYIQLGDRQIPLKGFKFGASGTGKSKVTESAVVAAVVAAPIALFIAGGEKHVDAGGRGFAKLKEDFDFTSMIAAPKTTAPLKVSTQPTEGEIQ
jgi:hypothetical protein